MKTSTFFSCAVAFFAVTSSLFAGGPLYSINGKAVRYQSSTISYKLDRGPLGIFTDLQARQLANESFQVWANVASSNLAFQHTAGDTLPVDVNESNYLQYTTLTDFKYDGINPIIFDSDGAITDALFGVGASESVIGFAGSGDQNNDGYYDEGEAIMNGVFADGGAGSFTLAEWKATFVHEFGHFIGLDHTQINIPFENDATKTIYIPTMYPFATINDTPLGELNPDDIAAVSVLYPEPSFAASTGIIAGSVVRANNAVVRGANVVAISAGSDSLMNQISTVTDYFEQNNGNFSIAGLSPGKYFVRIEPIDPAFTEGSSVGPYSWESTGLSFVNPVTTEYYNGVNESGTTADDPLHRDSVTVTAGATTAAINFIANSSGSSGGSTLMTENFTAAAGTALTSAGWTISGSSTVNVVSIVQPGLTFSGYPSSDIGNAARLNTNGQDVFQPFASVNSGSVYLSFMMKVDSAKTGDYFIALSPIGSQTNYLARLHVKSSGAGFTVGISKQAETAGGNTYGTTVYSFGSTYLVVVKYEFVPGGTTNDAISVYVFSSLFPTSEPGTPAIGPYTNATRDDAGDLGNVTLRQGSAAAAPYLTIDGIRVSTGWPGTTTFVRPTAGSFIPATMELMQNYPNPFNPTTVIRFALPVAEFVTLKVFDVLGREISTVVRELKSAGIHEVSFDASPLSGGTYFYRLETPSQRLTKRMVLIK